MSVLRERSWLNLLILLLASGLLAGCLQQTEGAENRLKGIARDFVTKLEFDVVKEEHYVLFGIRHDMPSNWVSSDYVISDAPEDVRERLKAFHDSHDFWLAPSNDGWTKDIKMQIIDQLGRPLSPGEVKEDLEFYYRIADRLKDDSGIDFFVICPWAVVGAETYAIVYSDVVILTEEGTLIIKLHSAAQDRCHDEYREQ